jgi:hypothetical protein
MNHLAIYNKRTFNKDYIALMLAGTRTIGLKFLARRTAPYSKLHAGDTIYLKESSGPIYGRIGVKRVHNTEISEPEQVMRFLSDHATNIGIETEDELYEVWKRNSNSRYLCWWEIADPQPAHYPVTIHKNGRQAWIANYDTTEELVAAFL